MEIIILINGMKESKKNHTPNYMIHLFLYVEVEEEAGLVANMIKQRIVMAIIYDANGGINSWIKC